MATSRPTHFGLLLFPGFEVLDVAGPIEILNTLSRTKGWEDLRLHVIARSSPLDPSDPAGDKAPGHKFQSQQVYQPTHTIKNAPPLDVLIVPGGFGANPKYCGEEIEYIRTVYPSLQYLFTVCTGAGLAAQANVLDGWRATTNKAVWDDITKLGPQVYWISHARWVVSGPNDNIWTTSGVSAGTDGMVAWIAAVYGEDVAEMVLPRIEYIATRNPDNDPFADYYHCVDKSP